MSIVDDQVRRYDALLDRYQLAATQSRRSSLAESQKAESTTAVPDAAGSSQLKAIVRALSTTAGSRPVLKRRKLRDLLAQVRSSASALKTQDHEDESDLRWLAVGKATVQLYGIILSSLLEQTIPLSESIWYWDEVLGSYSNTALYTAQTSPLRFWKYSKEVYHEAKARYQSDFSIEDAAEQSRQSLTAGWREFYRLVQESINDRSLIHARTRILSPFALSRTEARQKQIGVKRLREQSAAAIGLLVDEGLTFNSADDDNDPSHQEWRLTVTRSISLLEALLRNAATVDSSSADFEDAVIDTVDRDPVGDTEPSQLISQLIHVIDVHLPEQESGSREMVAQYGKPHRLIRYWIPGVLLVLSGSTLLRFLASRRAEITEWIRDLGATTVDFWYNWVVDPVKRLVGTIRHDENSELAIMSRDSLKADRDSLERMVVEFAVQHPENGTAYTDVEIADIRTKVKQGDVTPVLRAYERDLQKPIVGVTFGNLIRTLLIQIQKTKVDVEVAMDGIDSLLKSQELLFGFVGLAPGVLVSYFLFRWMREVFGSKQSLRQTSQRGETVRLLRNIDRVLNNSQPTESGVLSYKDHGLLLCEVHVLRQRASHLLPGKIQREFLEDLDDLMDIRQGVARQMKVVDRIHWAYSKWLK